MKEDLFLKFAETQSSPSARSMLSISQGMDLHDEHHYRSSPPLTRSDLSNTSEDDDSDTYLTAKSDVLAKAILNGNSSNKYNTPPLTTTEMFDLTPTQKSVYRKITPEPALEKKVNDLSARLERLERVSSSSPAPYVSPSSGPSSTLLSTALKNLKSTEVPLPIYTALEEVVQESLKLNHTASETAMRLRIDSVCRGLTDLCIALREQSAENRFLRRDGRSVNSDWRSVTAASDVGDRMESSMPQVAALRNIYDHRDTLSRSTYSSDSRRRPLPDFTRHHQRVKSSAEILQQVQERRKRNGDYFDVKRSVNDRLSQFGGLG